MGGERNSRNRQNKSSRNPDVKQGRPKEKKIILGRQSEAGKGIENDKEVEEAVINILKRERNVKTNTIRKKIF
jgi:hypothetical protein